MDRHGETPAQSSQEPDAEPATSPEEVERDGERDQAEGGDQPEESSG